MNCQNGSTGRRKTRNIKKVLGRNEMHSIVRKVGKGSSIDLTMSVTTERLSRIHISQSPDLRGGATI